MEALQGPVRTSDGALAQHPWLPGLAACTTSSGGTRSSKGWACAFTEGNVRRDCCACKGLFGMSLMIPHRGIYAVRTACLQCAYLLEVKPESCPQRLLGVLGLGLGCPRGNLHVLP